MNKLHYTLLALVIVVISAAGILAAPHLYGGIASVFPQGIEIGPMTISPNGIIAHASESDIDMIHSRINNSILIKVRINSGNATLTNLTAKTATIIDGSGIQKLDGSRVYNGTVPDARIASTIARDSELKTVSDSGIILELNFNKQNIKDNKILDSSGYNHHAYLISGNALVFSEGIKNSTGLKQTNSSKLASRIDINKTKSIILSDEATWVFWAKKDSAKDNRGIMSKYDTSGNNRGWKINDYSTSLSIVFSSDGTSGTLAYSSLYGCQTTLGQWSYHVITYNKGNLTGYKNGVICDTDVNAVKSLFNASGTPISIFRDTASAGSLNGTLDGIRIYNRSLTAEEVKILYDTTDEGKDSFVSQNDIWVDFNGFPHITKICFNDACTAYRNASCDVYANSTHTSSVCI